MKQPGAHAPCSQTVPALQPPSAGSPVAGLKLVVLDAGTQLWQERLAFGEPGGRKTPPM